MGLNFRKSISLGKGLKLNLSKSGPSVSFGKSGFRQSVNLKGQARTTVGIPGTGIYYTKNTNVKNVVSSLTGKAQDAKNKKAAGKAAAEPKAAKSTKAAAAGAAGAAVGAKAAAKPAVNEELIAASKAKVEEFAAGIEALKSVHKQSDGYIDWEALANGAVSGQLKELQPFAQSVLAGDIDAYFNVIAEVGTDDPQIMQIEFQVKSGDIVPTQYPDMKANGELVMKDFTKSAYYELVQDYVSSTMLRVARDTFALLPVKAVLIHAVDKVLNPATGNDEEVTIASVKIKRDALATLNFERIDPSDCLESFESNIRFKKTTGYAPVDRVLA